MNKDIIIPVILIGVTILAGVYFVGIALPEERQAQRDEAEQVASNLRSLSVDDINCTEAMIKITNLNYEHFEGSEIIRQAWIETQKRAECETMDVMYIMNGTMSP